jgi:AbrB family looped-hinge helix DNA binding protein
MSYIAVKTIDYAGRIVLPKAYRTKMCLDAGSTVILQEEDGRLFIEPASKKCRLCECNEIVDEALPLCKDCLEKAKNFNK